MVVLNAEKVKSEDDLQGNYSLPCPGRYHVAVNHAEEKGNKKKGTPGLQIEFQVICDGLATDGKSLTNGQIGKIAPLFLAYMSEKGDDATQSCLDRVTRLAICCGVLSPGKSAEPDWNDAIGRELVIEIEAGKGTFKNDKGEEQQRKDQVAYIGFWSLGNKEVANVQKDITTPGMQALKKSGGNGSSVVSTPTPPPETETVKRSKFSDLL